MPVESFNIFLRSPEGSKEVLPDILIRRLHIPAGHPESQGIDEPAVELPRQCRQRFVAFRPYPLENLPDPCVHRRIGIVAPLQDQPELARPVPRIKDSHTRPDPFD